MNDADFAALIEIVSAKAEGWEDHLIVAWDCLQRNQLQIAILTAII
jgi:hypothetical protein